MGRVFNVIYCTLTIFTTIVMGVVDTIFRFIYGRGKTVPSAADKLILIPAHQLANQIRRRKLRAEDVMSAYIARAKEVNPYVNAIVGDQYDRALRRAQDLDHTLDALSQEERNDVYSAEHKPLLGVPLSVKEAFSWTGMTNTSGIMSRKHLRSKSDAPVLRNLQEAGAIPFILTNTSEACMWFESSNYVYGCTNNAYDTTRIVGGSSGGEGCILSTGASVIGIGSDIGGSIRMPCFFNGVFGHKPSIGVVDNLGQFPIASAMAMPLLSTGPMCRYASDLEPQLRVMAGPDGVAKLKLDKKVDLSRLRVISVPDDGGSLVVSKVDPQLKDAQRKVCDFLARKGATVEEKRYSRFRIAFDMWAGRMNLAVDNPKFSEVISGEDPQPVNCLLELGKWFVGSSNHTLPALLLGVFDDVVPNLTKKMDEKAVQKLDSFRQEMISELTEGSAHQSNEVNGVSTDELATTKGDDLVQRVNGNSHNHEVNGERPSNYDGTILLYPSHPKIAPYHNHPILTPYNFAYTGLFNALGFPVTQCPLGLSKEGLPMGVQVVTAPYCDHVTLAVARALEVEFGGWVNPGTK